MKRTPWTLALTLLFATSAVAFADHHRDSVEDRCPRPGQMERVTRLAEGIDELAEEIHERTERNNRRPDRYVARVIGDLHDLSDAAARFYDEVEGSGPDPRRTRDDFRELVRAFRAVTESIQDIEPRSYIDRGIARIGELLSEIDDHYGVGDRYGSSRRHGR